MHSESLAGFNIINCLLWGLQIFRISRGGVQPFLFSFNLFSIFFFQVCNVLCARHRCMTAAGQHKYCKHFLQPEHKFSRARNLWEWRGPDTSGRARHAALQHCSIGVTCPLQHAVNTDPAVLARYFYFW